MNKRIKVPLTLKSNENVAREVAYSVFDRSNPHASSLIDNKLSDAGITVEALSKYFLELGKVVESFGIIVTT